MKVAAMANRLTWTGVYCEASPKGITSDSPTAEEMAR
jgi:hypothetical protein